MSDEAAAIARHVDAIAERVEGLVGELVQLKAALGEEGVELLPWLSYRLAVILSRVDHAAAEIVIQQARKLEAAELPGQLPAFPELVDRRLDELDDAEAIALEEIS